MHACALNTQRMSRKVTLASKAYDCHRIDFEERSDGLGADERLHFKQIKSPATVTIRAAIPIRSVWEVGFLAVIS